MSAGETRLSVDGRDRNAIERLRKLSDGKWHRIDIFQHRKVGKSVVSDSVRITINICLFNSLSVLELTAERLVYGFWTTHGYANWRTANSRTGRLADATCDFACLVFVFLAIRETVSCPVRDLGNPRVIELPGLLLSQLRGARLTYSGNIENSQAFVIDTEISIRNFI